MSTTIDQRVVEMRFDNQNFEKNVSHTMSTLDKLKQKLHLTGASKGLEEVNSAAKKVDMNGLGKGVEAVTAKFSALQVVGTTALVNLTNQAVNAGKRIVSSLTVAPVGDGFKEYEMTLNAVQTTMAGTGKTAEEVEAQLKKLDEYADKTVYGTADMLNNLPKFTNAGVELEKATTAMIGIANATALAGGDAGKASIAFYNLGQAIGTGYLTRMDYNSINNAGIATMEWKESMVEAAIAQGTLTKVGEDAYQAGNKTLTLQQLFIDGLQEQWATTEVMMKVFGDYGDETTEIGKKAYSAAQDIKTYTMMMESLKATAGTGWKDTWQIVFGGLSDAKKFWTGLNNVISDVITRMGDFRNGVLESALGSKWDKLVSKIEDAGYTTEQFTEKLTGVLEESGISVDELNEKYGSLGEAIAAGAVPVKKITTALKRLLGVEDDAKETTDKITMSVEELDKVARRVWRGEFGNGAARVKALTEAGYDYVTVQNKVNELMGVSYRLTPKLTEEQLANADSLARMTDEQLKAKGYTEQQIEALRELEKAAEGADSSITDLINDLEKPSGRTLLIESFKNMWTAVKDIFGLINEAWTNIFGEKDAEDYADGLYKVIEKFHELTESMKLSEGTANNFRTIMEGLFAGFQLTGSIASKSVIAGIKLLDAVLGLFGTDLLGVAAKLAEYIVIFNDWVKTHTMFGYGTQFSKIAEVLFAVYEGVSKCVKAFINLEKVQSIVSKFKELINSLFADLSGPIDLFSLDGIITAITEFFNKLESWIKGIDTAEDLGKYILDGIRNAINGAFDRLIAWVNGLGTFDVLGMNIVQGVLNGMLNAAKSIFNIAVDIAVAIYDAFCDFFQVKSPSRLMMTLGGFIVSGLILGIVQGFGDVSGVLQDLLAKCTSGLDWSKFSAIFWNISALLPSAPIFNAIAAIGNTFAVFGEESGGDIISGLVKGIAGGVQKVVTTIIELASKLISGFKDKIDSHSPSKVFMAIGGFIIAGLILGLKDGLISVPESMQGIVDKCLAVIKNIDWSGLFAVGISIAGLMMVKRFADILEAFSKPFGKLGDLFSAMKDVVKSFGDVTKAMALNIKAKALKQLAIALAIMVGSVVAITLLVDDPIMLWNAVGVIGAMVLALVALAMAMNQMGEASLKFEKGKGFSLSGLKQNLIAIGVAVLLIGGITAILGRMEEDELKQGFKSLLAVMGSMLLFVGGLQLLGKIKGTDNIDKVGGMAFKVAIAMALMVGVVKMVGKLRPSELTKGIIFMSAFGLFIRALISSMPSGSSALHIGKDGFSKTSSGKLGGMILGVTIAMMLMVALCKIVAKLETREMVRGAGFATAFIFFVKYLVKATTIGTDVQIAKLGGLVLSISSAMIMLVGMCKLVGKLTPGEMFKGAAFATAFLFFVKGLVMVTTVTSGTQMAKIAGTLLGLSIAIGVLAGICTMLSVLDWEQLAKGSLAVGLLSTFMIGMLWAARGVNEFKGTMIAMVVGIGLLVAVMAALTLIKDPKKLIAPVAALGTLLVTYGYALRSMAGVTPQKGLMKTLIMMLGATMILGGIVTALSFIPNPDGALKASIGLSALLLALTGAMKILGKAGSISKSVSSNLGVMLLISAGLAVILGVFTALPKPERAIPAAVAMGILLNTYASSIAILKTGGSISRSVYENLGILFLITSGLTLVLGALTSALHPNPERAIPAAVAMGILLNTFASSIAILKTGGSISKSVADNLAIMLLVSAGLGLILGVFTALPNPERAIPAAVAMGILLNTFASSIAILKTGGSISASVTKNLLPMVGVAALLTPIVWALSRIQDPTTAMANAVTLSGLMAVMTGLMAAVAAVGKYMNTGLESGITGLSAMVIPFALFVAALHFMPDLGNAREKITALTSLMVAMTILLPIVSVIGKFLSGGMVAGIIGLTAMAIPLYVFACAISKMPDISAAKENVLALTQAMVVMTGLLAVLAVVGLGGPAALVGVGSLLVLIVAIGALVAGIGFLLDKFPQIQTWVDKGIPLLIQLAGGIGEMMGAFIGALSGAIGGALVQLGEDIAEFMACLSTAADNASGIEAGSFDGVYDLMKALAGIAGVAVGTQIADMFLFFTGGGTSMDKFKTDALAFFEAMKEIAPKMAECQMPENFSAEGILSLLEALKKIGGYSVGMQFADLFTFGGTAMDKFKADAIAFFEAMSALPEHMVGFNFPADFNVEGLETLLTVLKKVGWAMAGVSIADLFTQLAGDEGAMEKFKTDAVNFFKAIKAITPEMVGFSFPKDFDIEGLTKLLDALKAVAWAMAGVSIADLFTQLAGDEGAMEKFQQDGTAFFTAIDAISGAMTDVAFPGAFDTTGLDCVLGALKTVASAMAGNWWTDFIVNWGKDDAITQFKNQGEALFDALSAISTKATGFTMATFDNHVASIDKLKGIFESLIGIDYSGVEAFTGIGTGWGGADGPVHDIAVAIKDFSSQLDEVDGAAVSTAVTNIESIKTFISGLVGLDTSGVDSYKTAIESLSSVSLTDFIESFDVTLPNLTVVGTNMTDALVSGIKAGKGSLQDAATKLVSTITSSVDSKRVSLTSAGNTVIDGLVSGMRSSKTIVTSFINELLTQLVASIRNKITVFKTTGTNLISEFATGMSAANPSPSSTMANIISSTLDATSGYYDSFYSAGSSLVDGFASGISANTWKAEAEAAAMAAAALNAAKKELDINSPSKVFRAIGYSVPEGFADGIDKMSGMAEKSASSMANGAINAVGDMLSAIATAVDSEVELQPKIRPVVDLTDIRAGAGSISSMLGFGTSVGVSTNLSAISSMMNSNQNGFGDDVVSAINKLRGDLSNISKPTYSINGLNYSNDAELEDAFETIIRYAKMERRS